MRPRLTAAATAIAIFALPAAAHAKHVVDHAPHGPSATPLLVELMLAGLIGLTVLTRKPISRALKARTARARRTLTRRRPATVE